MDAPYQARDDPVVLTKPDISQRSMAGRLRKVKPGKALHEQFDRAWSAVAYLFPGLHPDGYEDAESAWPRALHRFAAEALRRADAGELADE